MKELQKNCKRIPMNNSKNTDEYCYGKDCCMTATKQCVCKKAKYCSSKCQIKHWKEHTQLHKKIMKSSIKKIEDSIENSPTKPDPEALESVIRSKVMKSDFSNHKSINKTFKKQRLLKIFQIIDRDYSSLQDQSITEDGLGNGFGWSNQLAIVRVPLMLKFADIYAKRVLFLEGYDRNNITIKTGNKGFAIMQKAIGHLKWTIDGDWNNAVYHDKPKEHIDFLFGELKYTIPADKRQEIQQITDSQYIYPLGRIAAACDFPGATVATERLMIETAEGDISDAQSRYSDRIKALAAEQAKFDKKYIVGQSGDLWQIMRDIPEEEFLKAFDLTWDTMLYVAAHAEM